MKLDLAEIITGFLDSSGSKGVDLRLQQEPSDASQLGDHPIVTGWPIIVPRILEVGLLSQLFQNNYTLMPFIKFTLQAICVKSRYQSPVTG